MYIAVLYGAAGGATLLLGAIIGLNYKLPKFLIGSIMAFGAGYLISTLTFELMEEAFLAGGFQAVSIGFLSGTLLFVLGDYCIDHFGGHNRKHVHGKNYSTKKANKMKKNTKDSGSAILLGAILDGIPESAAIGIGLAAGNGVGLSMMLAVLLSNVPEGISGAQGMKKAGKSARYILSVWGITLFTSAVAAGLGYAFLGNASPETIAITLSLAAGAILAMIGDTMIPEAFEDGGRFVAISSAIGFFISFVISHLAG